MTDQEKIDSLQKQLDLSNSNYNILNQKYLAVKKENKNLRTVIDYFVTKNVLHDLTEGD